MEFRSAETGPADLQSEMSDPISLAALLYMPYKHVPIQNTINIVSDHNAAQRKVMVDTVNELVLTVFLPGRRSRRILKKFFPCCFKPLTNRFYNSMNPTNDMLTG